MEDLDRIVELESVLEEIANGAPDPVLLAQRMLKQEQEHLDYSGLTEEEFDPAVYDEALEAARDRRGWVNGSTS